LKKTILVVDDDQVIRKTTSIMLEAAGYNVATAKDSSEALRAINGQNGHTPDIVLLDLNFPPDVSFGGIASWNGVQLLQWVRSSNADVRFIIVTGDNPATVRAKGLTDPAITVFRKPLDYAELLVTISTMVGEGDVAA
jgi:CheY-like chemotaxis protein